MTSRRKTTKNIFGNRKYSIKPAKPGTKRNAFFLKNAKINRFLNKRFYQSEKSKVLSKTKASHNANSLLARRNIKTYPQHSSPPSTIQGADPRITKGSLIADKQKDGQKGLKRTGGVLLTGGKQSGTVKGNKKLSADGQKKLSAVDRVTGVATRYAERVKYTNVGPELLAAYRFYHLDDHVRMLGDYEPGATPAIFNFRTLLKSRFIINRQFFQLAQLAKKFMKDMDDIGVSDDHLENMANKLKWAGEAPSYVSGDDVWNSRPPHIFSGQKRSNAASRDAQEVLALMALLQGIEGVMDALDFKVWAENNGYEINDGSFIGVSSLADLRQEVINRVPLPKGGMIAGQDPSQYGSFKAIEVETVGWVRPDHSELYPGRTGTDILESLCSIPGGNHADKADWTGHFWEESTATRIRTQLLYDMKMNLGLAGPASLGPFVSDVDTVNITNARTRTSIISAGPLYIAKTWDYAFVDASIFRKMGHIGMGLNSKDPIVESNFRQLTEAFKNNGAHTQFFLPLALLAREISNSLGMSLTMNLHANEDNTVLTNPDEGRYVPKKSEDGPAFLERAMGKFTEGVFDIRSMGEGFREDGTLHRTHKTEPSNPNALGVMAGGREITRDESNMIYPFERYRLALLDIDTPPETGEHEFGLASSAVSGRQALLDSSLNPANNKVGLLTFEPLINFQQALQNRLDPLEPFMKYSHGCYGYNSNAMDLEAYLQFPEADMLDYPGQMAQPAPIELVHVINEAIVSITEGITTPINTRTATFTPPGAYAGTLTARDTVITEGNAWQLIILHILKSMGNSADAMRLRYRLFRIIMLARQYRSGQGWETQDAGGVENNSRTTGVWAINPKSPTGADVTFYTNEGYVYTGGAVSVDAFLTPDRVMRPGIVASQVAGLLTIPLEGYAGEITGPDPEVIEAWTQLAADGFDKEPDPAVVDSILEEFMLVLHHCMDDIVDNTPAGGTVFGSSDPLGEDANMNAYLEMVGFGPAGTTTGMFTFTGTDDDGEWTEMSWQIDDTTVIEPITVGPFVYQLAGAYGEVVNGPSPGNDTWTERLIRHLRNFIMSEGGTLYNDNQHSEDEMKSVENSNPGRVVLGEFSVFETILGVVDSIYRACDRVEKDAFLNGNHAYAGDGYEHWVAVNFNGLNHVTRFSRWTDSTVHFLVFDTIIDLLTGGVYEGGGGSLPLDLVQLVKRPEPVGFGGGYGEFGWNLDMVIHTFEAGVVATAQSANANLNGAHKATNMFDPMPEGQHIVVEGGEWVYDADIQGYDEISLASVTKEIIPSMSTFYQSKKYWIEMRRDLLAPLATAGLGIIRLEQADQMCAGFYAPINAYMLMRKQAVDVKGAIDNLPGFFGSIDGPGSSTGYGKLVQSIDDIRSTYQHMMNYAASNLGDTTVPGVNQAIQMAQLQVQKVKRLTEGGLASAINRVHALTSRAGQYSGMGDMPSDYMHTDLPGVSGCSVLETPSTIGPIKPADDKNRTASLIYRGLMSLLNQVPFLSDRAARTRVLAVGIPNGLFDNLVDGFTALDANRGNVWGGAAGFTSPTIREIDSSLIKITVHRKNHLYPAVTFKPLEFIYDMFVYPRTFDQSAAFGVGGSNHGGTSGHENKLYVPTFHDAINKFQFARVDGFYPRRAVVEGTPKPAAADFWPIPLHELMSLVASYEGSQLQFIGTLNTMVIVNRGEEIIEHGGFNSNSDTAVCTLGLDPNSEGIVTPHPQPDHYTMDGDAGSYRDNLRQDALNYIEPMLYNHAISFLFEKYYQALTGLRVTENTIQNGLMGFLNDLVISEEGVLCVNILGPEVASGFGFALSNDSSPLYDSFLPANANMMPGPNSDVPPPVGAGNILMSPTGILAQGATGMAASCAAPGVFSADPVPERKFWQIKSYADGVADGTIMATGSPLSVAQLDLSRRILHNLGEFRSVLTRYQAYPKPIDRVFHIPVNLDDFYIDVETLSGAAGSKFLETALSQGFIVENELVPGEYILNLSEPGSGDEVALDDFFCTVELLFGGRHQATYRPSSPSILSMIPGW